MVSKKIFQDVQKFLSGKKEYTFINPGENFMYPIDLDFTLDNELIYYHPKDKMGVPLKEYKSVGSKYNPTRVAAYGLSHWNRYQLGNNNYNLEEYKKVLGWFEKNHEEGKWYYYFDWEELSSPWISCMAQGEAISILTRGYFLTKDPKYLDIAILALSPFEKSTLGGGVLSLLNKNDIFFEEYPVKDAVHVLNGFLYSLIGIIELRKILPEDHSKFERVNSLLSKAIGSIERNIGRWEFSNWSTYDLSNENTKIRNYCTISYHSLQVSQLKYISNEVGSKKLLDVSNRWEGYMNSPLNRIHALIGKSYFRLKNPAQR
ncbi:D-glucuronyl C5-epimerase family protein [Oceanobacillus damuensis]|uniref:D-glucuronyl C5-epimerase family protein n=1 Tax=Oceanobacillus damuensis TaxID=937928 RepID=UPI00082D3B1D|nr:D-glucuronyl C5-epimerase family protein [Oceanobacillus damuensis]